MRYSFFFIFLAVVFTSCKPPLPVYFDRPIGTRVQGFDTLVAGNYVALEDVLEKGIKEFSARYEVKYDKIVLKDTGVTVEPEVKDINNEVKEIIDVSPDSGKEVKEISCDSIFNSLCKFNSLITVGFGSQLDKKTTDPGIKIKAGMIKIAYDRVLSIAIDSAGNNIRDTLVTLGPSIQLTKYAGKYFLNFKTPFGWEILQLDVWENDFLSARPFYFTGYDGCPDNAAALMLSTKKIYPDLKPILKDKKVIGFTAVMSPKAVLDAFKRSEISVLLIRVK